ncbi:MAG TPA: hypothetical protein VJY33_09960 [Isosphaeraceae bacterium]|nr:hypothetical protein [Isosphaeraceae bacterium]
MPQKIFRPRLPTAAVEHNVDTGCARALSGFHAKVEVVSINQYERYVVQHRWSKAAPLWRGCRRVRGHHGTGSSCLRHHDRGDRGNEVVARKVDDFYEKLAQII